MKEVLEKITGNYSDEPSVEDVVKLFARSAGIYPNSLYFSEKTEKQKIAHVRQRIKNLREKRNG